MATQALTTISALQKGYCKRKEVYDTNSTLSGSITRNLAVCLGSTAIRTV